jgi:penicillin-binding protein 2
LADILSLAQVPPLRAGEGRLFGIGHGNLRVTPLQVANSFATLARDGRRRPTRLFRGTPDDRAASEDLGISDATLRVVRDGMRAVVEEPGGTAYEAFGPSGLSAQGVRVYGKTGSTEAPENAWFAAFVEDDEGAKLAIAVVVEGGLSGTRHGAPLGRELVQACIEAGYVGKAAPTSPLLAP